MLDGAKRILELYDNDEFKPFIIEGDHGYGKSSYANRLIAEVYSEDGIKGNWRTSIFEAHMGFHPKLVINKWRSKKFKDRCFHWDDAGLWLHSLDFQNKFVKATGKYMQVVRNKWACVMFTAISREDITSKIRGVRNAIIIEITKEGCDPKSSHSSLRNRRTANAYILRKGWKGREWKDYQWKEHFDCYVPGEYEVDRHGTVLKQSGFYGWYKPQRNKYSKIAEDLMKKSIEDDEDFVVDDEDLV